MLFDVSTKGKARTPESARTGFHTGFAALRGRPEGMLTVGACFPREMVRSAPSLDMPHRSG